MDITANRDPIPGVTTMEFGDGAGLLFISDEWAQRIQKERGEAWAVEHFSSIYGPEGLFVQGTLRAAELRGSS